VRGNRRTRESGRPAQATELNRRPGARTGRCPRPGAPAPGRSPCWALRRRHASRKLPGSAGTTPAKAPRRSRDGPRPPGSRGRFPGQ